MPFGPYKDFDACVLANKNKKSPAGYCAALHKKILGKWPGQTESYSDPLVIEQPKGTKFNFSVVQSISDQLSEHERKSTLYDIMQCKLQSKPDVFKNLWSELGLEYAESVPDLVDDSSELSVYLSDIAPDLQTIDLSKVVIRCATDLHFQITISEHQIIHWLIPQNHSSIQYLESGIVKSPVRNKFIVQKPNDIIHVDVGEIITSSVLGTILAEGQSALGLSTNDMHEYFLWFTTEDLQQLSGRWTVRFSEDEWSIGKNYLFPAPFILSASSFVDDLHPLLEEGGITCFCYSPELLPILEADELGKQWLQDIPTEKIKEIYTKYSPKVVEPPAPFIITIYPSIKEDTLFWHTDTDFTYQFGNDIYKATCTNSGIDIIKQDGTTTS